LKTNDLRLFRRPQLARSPFVGSFTTPVRKNPPRGRFRPENKSFEPVSPFQCGSHQDRGPHNHLRPHNHPAQRGGARCGSDGVVLRAKPGGRERAEPRGSEGPRRGRSERPAETRWASPSDHAHRSQGHYENCKTGCGAADVSSLDFFATHSRGAARPNKVAKNSQRSSSTRRPLRLSERP